jgi:hypothetical protein
MTTQLPGGWLDNYFSPIQTVFDGNTPLPQEPAIVFVGAESIVDNPSQGQTVVTLPAGSESTTQVIVDVFGNVTAQNNYEYFVDLYTAGGAVTFVTSSLLTGQGFSVYLIDPTGSGTGGRVCTIQPITPGNHIDALFPPSGPVAPGTLTTSAVLNAVGESISLTTPDGTNLWGVP